jgi:hypothetical protein
VPDAGGLLKEPAARLKIFCKFAAAVQLFLLLLRKKTDSVFLNLSCETKTSSKIPTLSLKANVINLRPVHLFYAKKRQNKCSW